MENNNTPLPDKNNKDSKNNKSNKENQINEVNNEKKEKLNSVTVEEYAKRLNISPAILAGVMERKKWFPGKRVEEPEFRKAVETFLKAPQGNIPKGENK